MKNEMEKNIANRRDATQETTRKVWHAPQMTVVSISKLTENNIAAGSDGIATSSKS